MTSIATMTTMTKTITTVRNTAVAVAGEQGGCAGACRGGCIHAQLKNGDNNGIVLDGSLLEDVVAGFGAGAIDGKSPNVETSDNNDDDNIRHHHPADPSFWVQMHELDIWMPLLLDSLDVSMVQGNFASHCYSVGGGGSGIIIGGSGCAHSEGNVREEEAEQDNDGFSSSGGGKR